MCVESNENLGNPITQNCVGKSVVGYKMK